MLQHLVLVDLDAALMVIHFGDQAWMIVAPSFSTVNCELSNVRLQCPSALEQVWQLMEGVTSTEMALDIAQQDGGVGIAVIVCLKRRSYNRRPNLEALVLCQPEDATTAPAM